MKKTAKAAALVAAVVLAAGLTACQKKDGAAQQPAGTAKAAKPTPVNEFSRELTEDSSGVRILEYNGSAKSVVIPAEIEGLPVKEIGEYAFINNDKTLKSVTVPDSVEKIGKNAFMGCKSLNSIIIPDSIEKIDEFVFCNCISLKSVTLGNSVKEIGYNAFSNTALESVTIPDSVEEIGIEAFGGCKSLKSVTLGNSVQKIGCFAFSGCSALQSLTIPDSLQKIKFVVNSYEGESGAFKGTELPLATQARLKALGYTGSF
ncbi:MAG: leucine-rich repeat domain-containing protein [Treponemataceae bacterium]|nr:leucine-rich repeat domain-containing protein [Treponemataceae bacterium]